MLVAAALGGERDVLGQMEGGAGSDGTDSSRLWSTAWEESCSDINCLDVTPREGRCHTPCSYPERSHETAPDGFKADIRPSLRPHDTKLLAPTR